MDLGEVAAGLLDGVGVEQSGDPLVEPTQIVEAGPRSQAGLDRDGRWVLDYHRAARCDQFLAAATYTSRLPDRSLDIINEGGFR